AGAWARRGAPAAAVDLAGAAVDIAAATDALLHHAGARLALAAALRVAGRHDEAAAEETCAIELWEAKGATVLAERARGSTPRTDEAPPDRIALARPTPRQVDEALARFDQPVTESAAVRPVRRRVPPNTATAHVARLDAAVAARDAEAFHSLFADAYEGVEHTTGAGFDRDGALSMARSL